MRWIADGASRIHRLTRCFYVFKFVGITAAAQIRKNAMFGAGGASRRVQERPIFRVMASMKKK